MKIRPSGRRIVIERMKELMMTQADVADKAEISRSIMNRMITKGRCHPRNLRKVCAALKLNSKVLHHSLEMDEREAAAQ